MKIVGISILVVLGFMFWRVTERLSSDALGVAIGLTLAGVFCGAFGFMGLLFYMAKRREDRYNEERQRLEQRPTSPYGHSQQPPIVILLAGQSPQPVAGETSVPSCDQRRMIDAAPPPKRGSFELLG